MSVSKRSLSLESPGYYHSMHPVASIGTGLVRHFQVQLSYGWIGWDQLRVVKGRYFILLDYPSLYCTSHMVRLHYDCWFFRPLPLQFLCCFWSQASLSRLATAVTSAELEGGNWSAARSVAALNLLWAGLQEIPGVLLQRASWPH